MDTGTRRSSTSTDPLEIQIAGLKWRLARAESDRDTWRAAGMQENYLAACSTVDALSLQLERLESARHSPAAPSVAISASSELAELCITFNGREYGYRGYRYDRFTDAVNYARLDRSRAFADPGVDEGAPLERTPVPNEAEIEVMRTLGITFADGRFHWREYRYERLSDAVAYARREHAEGSRSLRLRRK
jgi:hypothetical protein